MNDVRRLSRTTEGYVMRVALAAKARFRSVDAAVFTAYAGWMIILLDPGDSFAASISYRYIAALGTEHQWAAALAVLTLIRTARLWGSYRLRQAASYVTLASWIIIGALFFLANHASLGAVFSLALAVACAVAFWREEG